MKALRSLLALAALAFATPTLGLESPTLKRTVTVHGEVVRLGDLIANAGKLGDVAIYRAPDLGTTGRVPAADVLAIATEKGLFGIDPAGVNAIEVTRASRPFSAQELTEALRPALAATDADAAAEAIDVEFEPRFERVHLPAEATGSPRLVDVSWDQTSGRFDAVLEVALRTGGYERRPLTGRASENRTVLVLAKEVQRGQVLTSSDVISARRPVRGLGEGALTEAESAIGQEAKRPMKPGQILRTGDLANPVLVKRGDVVTITHHMGGMTLTARGQAGRDGVKGEAIPVTNLLSKRIVQATVVASGEVVTVPPRPLTTAAAR